MDFLSSELKLEFTSVTIIGYIYSFIISLIFISYYRNRKYSNCFLFFINVLHMSLIFFLPIISYISLSNEKLFVLIKDGEKCFQTIKMINMVNQVLNKLFYPLVVVYYQSGFVTLKNKITNLTFSDFFWELYAYAFIIVILILYFPLKEELLSVYHNDELLYFLNYLNIWDLIYTYFEIGFSCGSLLRYFYAVFTRREEYRMFILGKLSLYEKNIKEEFGHRFTKLYLLANLYSSDINKYNLDQITKFISDVDYNEYFQKDRYKNPFEKAERIKKSDLEKVLSKPFALCKYYYRKIDRINTMREHQINIITNNYKKRCCGCLYRFCVADFCKRVKCLIFAIVCLAILVAEGFYFANSNGYLEIDNKNNNNTDINNYTSSFVADIGNTKNTTGSNIGVQLGSLLLLYPVFLIVIFATCGIYLIPILYAVIRRTIITGDFIYQRGTADTLQLVVSVRKLSSMIFSALYLSSLFYITFILRESFPKNSKGEYNEFLKFYELPLSPVVLALRYVYIIGVMILTRLIEKINCKCFEVGICDECCFEPRPCEPCFKICVEGKRKSYLREGAREIERVLGNGNTYIKKKLGTVDLLV